jgi:hypothetical protein
MMLQQISRGLYATTDPTGVWESNDTAWDGICHNGLATSTAMWGFFQQDFTSKKSAVIPQSGRARNMNCRSQE